MQHDILSYTQSLKEIADIEKQLLEQQAKIQTEEEYIRKIVNSMEENKLKLNTLKEKKEDNDLNIQQITSSINIARTQLEKLSDDNAEQQAKLQKEIEKQQKQLEKLDIENKQNTVRQGQCMEMHAIHAERIIPWSRALIDEATSKIEQLTSQKELLLQPIVQKQAEIETFKSEHQCLQNLQDDSVASIQDAIDNKQKQINVCDNQLKEQNVMLNQFQDSMVVYHTKFAEFAGEGKTINLGANDILEQIEKILHNLKQCMLGLMNSRYTKEEYQSKNAKFVKKVIEERECTSSSVDKSNNLIIYNKNIIQRK